LQAGIELCRVIEPLPPEIAVLKDGKRREEISKALSAQANDYLNGVAKYLSGTPSVVTCRALSGEPFSEIIKLAKENTGALIAISTHGRSGVRRWATGSVMDKVLHGAANPLLVIRAKETDVTEAKAQLANLIVALDGSALAEQAMEHVASLAKAMSLKVNILRVVPTQTYFDAYSDVTSFPTDLLKEMEHEAETYLGSISNKLKQQGLASVSTSLKRGDAAGAILEAAQGTPQSLIVLTTHGRSGIGRAVLGSVTDRVVSNSQGPVLVIR
jgi:nucleotide-binding universal stress UspA family protein